MKYEKRLALGLVGVLIFGIYQIVAYLGIPVGMKTATISLFFGGFAFYFFITLLEGNANEKIYKDGKFPKFFNTNLKKSIAIHLHADIENKEFSASFEKVMKELGIVRLPNKT